MKMFAGSKLALRFVVAAVLVALIVSPGVSVTQDPNGKPEFGEIKLKAGFPNDPFVKEVVAGGDIESKHGGLTQYVAKNPDFRLIYEAGNFPLTIYAECKDEDTTLLINLPDEKWVANDDGPNTGLNPLIKFAKPQSGQYDIWVGTLAQGKFPKAVLKITELK